MTTSSREVSLKYLRETIYLAKRSPPKPTNFRVGCVIVSFSTSTPEVLSTGYTLELPGNTHAEQCALSKLVSSSSHSKSSINEILTPHLNAVLYTSLEPCGQRLSGNIPCVQRIIDTRNGDPNGGIRKVVFGAKEPGTFVADSQSCQRLSEAGIEWEYVDDFEKEILSVAMAGHHDEELTKDITKMEGEEQGKQQGKDEVEAEVERISSGGKVQLKTEGKLGDGDIGDDDSGEQSKGTEAEEAAPRNPKKRMMEELPL